MDTQEDGLLKFITKTSSKAARKRAFETVTEVLCRAQGEVGRYAQPVLGFARRFVATEVGDHSSRADALQLAASLLSAGDAPLPPGVVATLSLTDLAKDVTSRVYGSDARAPGGVRAGLFALLGALASRYATEAGAMANNEPLTLWVRSRALAELRHQAEAKKPEGLVMEGALDALSGALDATPAGTLPPAEAANVLADALSAAEAVSDAHRYYYTKAGLRLLTRHAASHLRAALLPATRRALDAVLACRLHSNAEVRQASKGAVDALFDALSDALCDEHAASTETRRAAYDAAWQAAETLLQDDVNNAASGETGSSSAAGVAVRCTRSA